MCVPSRDCARGWVRFAYNHNPFYVISAVLVLYGLHVSFANRLDPADGWLFTEILMGYILLLAATGVLIVRLGQVWEDARTLVLLAALLMVALASSFDRVCLDNASQGARFLVCGLFFSIALSELLLRVLKLRFPWPYRLAFYALLALLFAYPAWLGRLSLNNRPDQMSWFVLGFPVFAAVIFASMAPAAHRRGADVADNGTPWGWPLYPWSLFVLLGVGVLLRAYAISMSFDATKGDGSGFQAYFLIPLLMSWFVLWYESSDTNIVGIKYFAVAAPLLLLGIALPGESHSAAQARYIDLLRSEYGSPIQIAAMILIAYYVYLWIRGNRFSEWGILAALGCLAVVDKHTLDPNSLAPWNAAPVMAAATLLGLTSAWYSSAARFALSAVAVVFCATFLWGDEVLLAMNGYLAIHLLLFLFVSLGLLYHDALGRFVAKWAGTILAIASLVAVVGYRMFFPGIPPIVHAAVAFALAAMAAAYWIKNRRFSDLESSVVCLVAAATKLLEQLATSGMSYVVLEGKQWIAWGALFFLLGLAVSLIKGGQIGPLRRTLLKFHVAVLGSIRSP